VLKEGEKVFGGQDLSIKDPPQKESVEKRKGIAVCITPCGRAKKVIRPTERVPQGNSPLEKKKRKKKNRKRDSKIRGKIQADSCHAERGVGQGKNM